jgi:hypothetical protein
MRATKGVPLAHTLAPAAKENASTSSSDPVFDGTTNSEWVDDSAGVAKSAARASGSSPRLGRASVGSGRRRARSADSLREDAEWYVPNTPIRIPGVEHATKFSATHLAVTWLFKYVGIMRGISKKPCVVLDIDGTILLNKGNRSFSVLAFSDFGRACKKNEITIFAVTARPDTESNRAWTRRQLKKCGIEIPDDRLYMRGEGQEYTSYKLSKREEIRDKGYTILVSCGDQFGDFTREAPENVSDDAIVLATMGDKNGSMSLKLPSE